MSIDTSQPTKETTIFDEILKIRNHSTLIIFLPSRAITAEDFQTVYLKMKNHKNLSELDVVVHSVGGYLEPAYKIALLLRKKSKKINLIIPEFAKSAATILAFGADEIIMSQEGELGPLDAQVEDPKNKQERMSTLDTFSTLNSIRDYTLETVDFTTRLLLSRGIIVDKALDLSIKLATDLAKPLTSQIDPLLIGKHYRITKSAEEYGKRLVEAKNGNVQKEFDAINKIVNGYPTHAFVIDIEEAKKLGLNVKEMTESEENEYLKLISSLKVKNLDVIEFIAI